MKLTVATYNILHGKAVDYDWPRLAARILSCGADLVGLQEVDMRTHRNGGCDTLQGMSETTGLAYTRFVPTMAYDGGEYGTAILSRWPIESFRIFPLQAFGYEPRACGCAGIRWDGGRLSFFNTHLTYEARDPRSTQFDQLAHLLMGSGSFLLTGDFNTQDFSEFAPLTGSCHGGLVNGGDRGKVYRTFRSPPMAIDNIIYDRNTLTLVSSGMEDGAESDHNLLWAEFSTTD